MIFSSNSKSYPLYKIILIGDSNVGKTSLINSFKRREDIYDVNPTIGAEFTNTEPLRVGQLNEEIVFQIWDTAGQEKYRSITSIHYRQVVGGIVVFDITNKNSFENVTKWCEELRYYSEPDLILIIVGNKNDKDKDRQINKQRGFELAKLLDAEYYETSLKKEETIERVFQALAEKVYEKREIYKKMHLERKKIILQSNENQRKCCKLF